MDVQITRSNDIWSYNPLTEGYVEDAVFSAITGTPTISSSKLRLNQAAIVTYDQTVKNGVLEIAATIPAVPTSGDARQFGFRKNTGTEGAIVFDITDAIFSAKVYDSAGTLVDSKTINWSSVWTAAEARYRIVKSERQFIFLINDTIVAEFNSGFDKEITTNVVLSRAPAHIYISNSNSDNVDISFVSVV